MWCLAGTRIEAATSGDEGGGQRGVVDVEADSKCEGGWLAGKFFRGRKILRTQKSTSRKHRILKKKIL